MSHRLLYLCNQTGFFVSHRLPIARAAVSDGWDVTLAAKTTSEVDAIKAAGITLIDLEIDPTGLNPLDDLRSIYMMKRAIARTQPDLVHAITIKPIIYGGALARRYDIPLVNSICGLGQPGRVLRPFLRQALRRALGHPDSITIFQNRDDLQALRSLCTATQLIEGAGVDLEFFRPRQASGGRSCTIVLPARMIESKGIRDFVAAAKILARQGVTAAHATFCLVGGVQPGNRGALKERTIRRWCSRGTVDWWRHCDDMRKVYRDADVVCLPSRGGEGVPKVLLEAMACGLPVVTTDVPGCCDVVRDGWNGLVVPPRSPERLAAAMQQMIELGHDLRTLYGRRGRDLAQRYFAVEDVIAHHLRLYKILDDRCAGSLPFRQADGTDLLLWR